MKDNKLIAEFIGVKPIVNDMSKEDGVNEVYDMYGVLDFLDDIEHEGNHYYNTNTMKFHESWDWLMFVVGKITRDEKYWENEYREYLMDIIPYAIIEDVYDAVVGFIKNCVSLEKE